jgi:hypothetical protein
MKMLLRFCNDLNDYPLPEPFYRPFDILNAPRARVLTRVDSFRKFIIYQFELMIFNRLSRIPIARNRKTVSSISKFLTKLDNHILKKQRPLPQNPPGEFKFNRQPPL